MRWLPANWGSTRGGRYPRRLRCRLRRSVAAALLAGALLAAPWPAPGLPAWAQDGAGSAVSDPPADLVHVIPVTGHVEFGLARFIQRAVREAELAGADLILFEIDTPGGRLDAALQIRQVIAGSPVPTAAYVTHWAISAGALIALAAEKLYMAPDASMGAAEPRPADAKTISAVRAEFEATARRHGRDPQVAAAMVDADVEIEGLVERGQILTLTGERALEIGFIDGTAATRAQVLQALNAGDARVVEAAMRGPERFARFVTDPVVAPILLALGFMGLLAELLLPGFGLPGLVGIVALSLFFGGHMLAGLAGWEVFVLFAVGIVLLAIEAFVPGFGLFGVAGAGTMILSIFLAAPTAADALRSLFAATGASIVLGVVLVRYAGARGLWRRLALGERLSRDQGFVAPAYPRELEGRVGRTLTPLRPAGAALIDGKRWDVVTEGAFVAANRPVRVVAVRGARIVVVETEEEETGADQAGPAASDVEKRQGEE